MLRRIPAATLALTLALTAGLGGCAEAERIVGDAQERVSEGLQRLRWCTAAFRLGAAVASQDVEAARSAAEDLRVDAPDELTAELDLIIEAVQEAESGNLDRIQSQEVRAAGQRVLEAAQTQCDPTTRP